MFRVSHLASLVVNLSHDREVKVFVREVLIVQAASGEGMYQ